MKIYTNLSGIRLPQGREILFLITKYINQIIGLGGILLVYILVKVLVSGFETEKEVKIIIQEGANLRNVGEEIKKNVPSFGKNTFVILGRIFRYDKKIIPGVHTIPPRFTYLDVLNIITNPLSAKPPQVTIPEGLTIKQIARLLKRKLEIDSSRFVEECRNDSLMNLIGIKASSLEGFLFPDTYNLNITSANPEREIINIMFSTFRKKVIPLVSDEIKKKKLNLLDLITLASIIEAETKYDPEKKTISGVYHNRLGKGMKLEADPTVIYSLPEPKKRLLYSDLKYPSPYNTYIHKGLPPGPINNPGLNSILAALYPEKHNYLYFVAKGDGSHRFAENYDEHRKNVELYREFLNKSQEGKTDEQKNK
ncbi:MAG: endolytic transglycosylase MltG [Ignavibacteria bacterium]|nr:endolytic transglycosylase MltG [Ignavibacteria bacterium]